MYCNSDEFQTLFNNNVNADKAKKEPDIVKSLHKTIQDLKNKGYKIESSFVHQKYCKYEDKNLQEKPIKRELADLLFVVRSGNIIRYTFIQFKNRADVKYYKGLNKFKINCGQHHLLIGNYSIVINGVKSNLLKNNKFDTATTYSVLYKDCQNNYNFDLSSAKSVICNDCSNKNSMCCIEKGKYHWANHLYNKLQVIKDEIISHTNIEEIFSNFNFGEVIKISEDKDKLSELTELITTFDNSDEILKILDIPLYVTQKEYICNTDKNNTHGNVGFLIGINEIKSTTK